MQTAGIDLELAYNGVTLPLKTSSFYCNQVEVSKDRFRVAASEALDHDNARLLKLHRTDFPAYPRVPRAL